MKLPCFRTRLYACVQYSSNFLNISPLCPPITNAISCVNTNLSLSLVPRPHTKGNSLHSDRGALQHKGTQGGKARMRGPVNATSLEAKLLLKVPQEMAVVDVEQVPGRCEHDIAAVTVSDPCLEQR